MNRFQKILPFVISGIMMALPVLADLPAGNPITIDDLGNLVGLALDFIIWLAMISAVIFIVLSGIMMMLARENPTAFSKAQTRLKNAIWGTFVVLGSGVIINTIMSVVDRSFFATCTVSLVGVCVYH